MNKISALGLFLVSLFLSTAHAQVAQVISPPAKTFPIVTWKSESPSDVKTIQNTTGFPYTVLIVVNDDGSDNAAGINITNCGQTSRIGPGSSALCNVADTANPVSFNSDRAKEATGTYQLQAPAS